MSHNLSICLPVRILPVTKDTALSSQGQGEARSRTIGPGFSAAFLPGKKVDRRNVESIRLRIGTANVGTMRGRSVEIVEMVDRRRLDFCCLQETRWRGGSARTMGKFKFFWTGCEEGTAGVGFLVAERWVEKVLEVKRVSARLMLLRVMVGGSVLNLISVYAPQVGRSMEKKRNFMFLF